MTNIKPVFTEKSFLKAASGTYTFETDPKTTKQQLKQKVQELFNVSVVKTTSIKSKGKTKRTGRRRLPTSGAPTKIIRVTLKKGQSISLFDIKKD